MAGRFDVGVVGSEYVGLVTAACLAHLGHRVRCIENDEHRLRGLASARMPFYEPGLEELVSRGVESGRLLLPGPQA
jgi:UDPglucose 6-dehydrogenase